MNFATRLVAGTLLVLVLTVAVLLWTAERSLRRDLESDVASTLESEARLIREALPDDSSAWDETVHRLSRENGRRITLVDSPAGFGPTAIFRRGRSLRSRITGTVPRSAPPWRAGSDGPPGAASRSADPCSMSRCPAARARSGSRPA